MRVIVIGIGNPIATDDGVGIRSVQDFQKSFAHDRVSCVVSERGGLELLDLVRDFDRAVVVDAARTGACPPGHITTLTARRPYAPATHRSLHTMELDSVLAFGSHMGMRMPDEVTILAVEAADIETFHEGCTPEVQSAIPAVVARLQHEVQRMLQIQETA